MMPLQNQELNPVSSWNKVHTPCISGIHGERKRDNVEDKGDFPGKMLLAN